MKVKGTRRGRLRVESVTGRRIVRIAELLLASSLLLVLGACATVPKVERPVGSSLAALLPPDALVYASIKVSNNRSLISAVMKASGLERTIPASISDKTKLLLASVSYSKEDNPVVSMVASGSFPVGLIGWKLNWSREWQRERVPLRWWQEKGTGAQIAVPTKSLVLFSTGALPSMLKNYTESSENPLTSPVQQAFDSSDLAIYFPKISENLPVLGMDAKRFPISSFYFSITAQRQGSAASGTAKEGEVAPPYHGFGLFKMKSERDARLFSVVFKLLIASSENGSAIGGFPIPLKGAQLTVDASTIRLTGITVSEEDLAKLLSTLVDGKSLAATK